MSARTPFMPRPSSRATGNSVDNVPPFVPGTAILPRLSVKEEHLPVNRQHRTNNAEPADTPRKVYGLATIVKKATSRKSIENIARPGTADALRTRPPTRAGSQSNSLKILAPAPRSLASPPSAILPSNQPLVSASLVFKTPALPLSVSQHSDLLERKEMSSNDPHIRTALQSLLVGPASALSERAEHSRSLEKIQEDDEMDSGADSSAFGANTPLALQGGPLRVLAFSEATEEQRFRQLTYQQEERGLRRVQGKRSRSEVSEDDDEDENYGNHTKRYKTDSQDATKYSSVRSTSPASEHSRYQHRSHSPGRSHSIEHGPPQHKGEDTRHQSAAESQAYPPATSLTWTIGLDTEGHLEEHKELHEQEIGRWQSNSMDDWIAGADELAADFGKVLDFVKNHMVEKMLQLADMRKCMMVHNSVLENHEHMLVQARAELVNGNAHTRGD